MSPEQRQQTIHDIVPDREIEARFYLEDSMANLLLGSRKHDKLVINSYLDSMDSDYELRVRQEQLFNGSLYQEPVRSFFATLKDKGGGSERLELEVPISSQAYYAHGKRDTARIYKYRSHLGEKISIDRICGPDGSILHSPEEYARPILEVEFDDKQQAEEANMQASLGFLSVFLSQCNTSSREIAESLKTTPSIESSESTLYDAAEVYQEITSKVRNGISEPVVVGIAGPSASGKTSFIRQLEKAVGKGRVSSLSLDDYIHGKSELMAKHKSEEWTNWDLPEVYDTQRAAKDLKLLKGGSAIDTPVFDFENGEPAQDETRRVSPSPIVVVEGLYALDNSLAELIDTAVYLDAPIEERVVRRISRDVKRCGWSAKEIFRYMMEVAEPTSHQYVEPQKQKADFIVQSC